MQERGVVGLAVARIEGGAVQPLLTLGQRSRERAEPLGPDTVLYTASLTKLAFAWMVLQLVDEGRLDLDAPLNRLLPQPLPEYPDWADLAGDARWQRLTPRLLLSHQSGLPNWRWLSTDQRLRFDHDPGTRYAYSGEGIQILQTVLEQGLGLDVDAEMRRRLFEPLGLTRTALTWQARFALDAADGYSESGALRPHAQRRRARLAGQPGQLDRRPSAAVGGAGARLGGSAPRAARSSSRRRSASGARRNSPACAATRIRPWPKSNWPPASASSCSTTATARPGSRAGTTTSPATSCSAWSAASAAC